MHNITLQPIISVSKYEVKIVSVLPNEILLHMGALNESLICFGG